MKILIIHHDADFDGLLSNEVCRFFLQKDNELTSLGWDYGKPIPSVEGFDQIYMVDISIDGLMDIGAVKQGQPILSTPTLIWIDHHKTAIQKYPPTLAGYRIDGVAACRLAWQWFTSKETSGLATLENFKNRDVDEPLILTLAGEHDIWDHHDEDALPLQDGLRQLEPFEWNELVSSQFEDKPVTDSLLMECISIGRRAMKARNRANVSIMAKRSHTIQWHGYRWLCCNGVNGSQAFDSRVEPLHEGLLAWVYDGQTKKVTVSLYHSPEHKHLDHSIIAKEFGGGGHAGACGFQLELEHFVDIIEPLYY